MNQAIHMVDLLQWLVGDVARSVFHATVAHVDDAPVTLDIVTERATLSMPKVPFGSDRAPPGGLGATSGNSLPGRWWGHFTEVNQSQHER